MAIDVVHLTQELVTIDSVSRRSNLAISTLLAERLETWGFGIEWLEFVDEQGERKVSLVAKKGMGSGGLAFFSHSDTVPGDSWGQNPWAAQIADGRLGGNAGFFAFFTLFLRMILLRNCWYVAPCIDDFLEMTMLIKPIKAEKTDIFAAHNYTVVPRAHHYPGRVKETHCHAMHEIAVIHQGACQLTLAEHSGRLPVHTAFFVPKGVDHSFVADPTEGFECHLVQFDELAPGLLHELRAVSPSYVFHLSKMDFHRFTHLFYQIQREVTTNSPYTTWQCQTLIEQIVILFLRSCRKTQTNNLSLDQQQAIEQALTFLHEHATDDLTISAVAHHVGLSPVYFRRLFHAYVGINPKHYLLNLRLQNAQFMLLQENRSITEIAMLSGFGSPQQFSKSFRQTIGLTPSEWRDPSRVKLGHNGSG